MSRTSRLASAVAAAALALTALPATAESTVALDGLSATAADGVVSIEGEVDFEHAGIELTDATGDGLAPTTDIASATVTRTNDRAVELSVTLADPVGPSGSSTVTMYRWETDRFIATAMHNRYSAAGDQWSFDLQECGQGAAGNECSSSSTFGTYADGVITWELRGILGFGDTFAPAEDGLHVTQTGAGAIWFNGFAFDTLDHGLVEIPEIEVTATNTATGVSVDDTPSRDDFDLELDGAPGDVIEVEACFDGACTTSTVVAS